MQTLLKTLVLIPTYNEKGNVERIAGEILSLHPHLDILFVDDNSPDGTGLILNRLTQRHPSIRVIHRPVKAGIGSAHREGIRWAYAHGYARLITLDCDFTHNPRYLKEFLLQSEAHDVVIGSRHLNPNSLEGWRWLRLLLTRLSHFLTRRLLGIPQDATSAFRAYRLDKIQPDAFNSICSSGYSFFFESLFWFNRFGLSIQEVPIVLSPRACGSSKMRLVDALQSLRQLFRLYRVSIVDPAPAEGSASVEGQPASHQLDGMTVGEKRCS